MYIRDKSRIYTGAKRSVAFGPLRVFPLFCELRASPRDPYVSEIKMPKQKVLNPKTETVILRVTPDVKQALVSKAAERNLTVTDFLTRAGLGRATRQRSDVDAINELRWCVDELKGIHRTLQQVEDRHAVIGQDTLDEAMRQVSAAIQRVWTTGGSHDR